MELVDYIRLGGFVGWILLGMLFLSLTLIMERSLYFLMTYRKLDSLQGCHTPCRSQIQRILNRYLELKDYPQELRNEELERYGALLNHEMERGLWLLEFISVSSPSLGLLGTVFGLIKSFQGMANAASLDIQSFSVGIWEAMLTTAFGLIVALPSLLFVHYFRRKLEIRLLHMGLAIPACEDDDDDDFEYPEARKNHA